MRRVRVAVGAHPARRHFPVIEYESDVIEGRASRRRHDSDAGCQAVRGEDSHLQIYLNFEFGTRAHLDGELDAVNSVPVAGSE